MSLFGKTPQELVYELMVVLNPKLTDKSVTLDKLVFATPSNIGGGTDDDMYTRLNTTLKVSGVEPAKVMGNVSLKYRRIFMEELFKAVTISVDATGVTNHSGLLPLIQAKYNLIIPASDVREATIASGSDRVVLTFNGSSLAWIGSLEVYLTDMPADAVDLTRVVTTTELNGLEYEDPA